MIKKDNFNKDNNLQNMLTKAISGTDDVQYYLQTTESVQINTDSIMCITWCSTNNSSS